MDFVVLWDWVVVFFCYDLLFFDLGFGMQEELYFIELLLKMFTNLRLPGKWLIN